MKMKTTRRWLEKRAKLEEGVDVLAGGMKLEELARAANALRQTPSERKCFATAFGTLIYFLRHQRGWSLSQLARKAEVDDESLENIEGDADYTPEPRTVLQLAKVFSVPGKRMLELAGLIVTRDVTLRDQVVLFAASGKALHKLTDEQQEALNNFVRCLAK